MRGLYVIADLDSLRDRRMDPIAFGRAVLRAHPAALQLRAKRAAPREVLSLLRTLAPMCRSAGVPLVANDRADLAALAGADMCHVGQQDVGIEVVRRLAPSIGVGVSTHTPKELVRAIEAHSAYVAYGPVFSTSTKADAAPVVGIEGLRVASALARSAGVPLVAIGGIGLDEAPLIAPLADAAAVISGLLPPLGVLLSEASYDEVTARALALHAALGGDIGGP